MSQTRTRIIALVAAIVFLVSSVATSIAVIWYLAAGDNVAQTPTDSQLSQNQQQLQVEDNSVVGTTIPNFQPMNPVTSLQAQDVTPGDGAAATATSTVTVTYTGALAKDGTIFDASGSQPVTFPLNQVIAGWQEGLVGMKVGGTRKLYIPAALAYGDQSPTPAIPPNSDLFFEVTLLNVQ